RPRPAAHHTVPRAGAPTRRAAPARLPRVAAGGGEAARLDDVAGPWAGALHHPLPRPRATRPPRAAARRLPGAARPHPRLRPPRRRRTAVDSAPAPPGRTERLQPTARRLRDRRPPRPPRPLGPHPPRGEVRNGVVQPLTRRIRRPTGAQALAGELSRLQAVCEGGVVSGRLLNGRYRLHSLIGRGGMAEVWRGEDLRLERRVAVKLLGESTDPDRLARFRREARTVARLSHPNIVTGHDLGVDGGVTYLVMELIEGTSLATRLAKGPLTVGDAVAIAGQVCDALAAAHAAGIVHRDIKPGNILLTPAGTVKVCDFGIARLLHASPTQLTTTGTVIGTSEYMAPEQASGAPVDGRTDLYALGCVLYAMLTGS